MQVLLDSVPRCGCTSVAERLVQEPDGLGSPGRLLTQWPGVELGTPRFLSSVTCACEAGGPASELTGMATPGTGIFLGDAESMADSKLCTPTNGVGVERRWCGSGESLPTEERGSHASPLWPVGEFRRGGKHELGEDWGVLEIMVLILQRECLVHPPDC